MPQIAIVGAGIAGLNAALTLHDAGLTCDLYEASNRVGGRMHSDSATWGDGMVSEACGEFIDADHSTIRQLIARFGLTAVALDGGATGATPGLLYMRGGFYPAEALDRDIRAIAPLLREQYHAAGFTTTYAQSTPTSRALDQMSVHAWIARYAPGGHETPLGCFLDSACSGFYGLDTREQSALNLIYLLGAREESSGSAMPQPLLGRSKIAGGNAQLPLAIARNLPQERLYLGHALAVIEREDDGSLTLTFTTADGHTAARYDYVILALPFTALRQADFQRAGFDERKRAAIERLAYGTISKLCLQFDSPYWYSEGPWPRPNNGFIVTDMAIQTLWDTSLGQLGAHGLLVDYTSGRHGAAFAPPTPYATTAEAPIIQRYAGDCLERLERVFPGVSAHYTGRASLSYPTGDPYLRGSYSCWGVGQYTAFAGYEGVRQGRALFAGEHCSLNYQGYMEGAAREGARAAHELIADARQE